MTGTMTGPRLILHIGPHKTSSSFIQSQLGKNLDVIRAHGYEVIPTDGGKEASPIARALSL